MTTTSSQEQAGGAAPDSGGAGKIVYHDVVTGQQIYGWRSACAGCGWVYVNTSPSLALRAAQLHGLPANVADQGEGREP